MSKTVTLSDSEGKIEMNDPALLHFDRLETPIGDLIMAAGDGGLEYVSFQDSSNGKLTNKWTYNPTYMAQYTVQMKEYLAGDRKTFTLKLQPQGTQFQQKVWQALTEIPFGTTITYGELAEIVGNPGASRAVGNANGRNPIVIVQPCHRVVAAQAKLGGFSAGIYRKRFLLGLEKGVSTLF